MHSVSQLKSLAQEAVLAHAADLVSLSHRIHASPELAFEEHQASAWVAQSLEEAFEIERGLGGLPTAFRATAGDGDLKIAICAEYDALPGLGHACGHNIIAAAAVGAGLALAPLFNELGVSVQVLGTPAEEGGGGKILLFDQGVFDDVHAAMMVHPSPADAPQMLTLAVAHFKVQFKGKEAHASIRPYAGINAADGMVVAQVALGLLRQQLRPQDQVHGIVTEGGQAANVIPALCEGVFMARAETLSDLEELLPRIYACFEAGALASGSELLIEDLGPHYSEFKANQWLSDAYVNNAEALGRTFPDDVVTVPGGSTDMANLSLFLPTIHPMVGIDAAGAVLHQHEFASAAVGPSADQAIIDGAIAMAWTVIDMATDPAGRQHILTAPRQPRLSS